MALEILLEDSRLVAEPPKVDFLGYSDRRFIAVDTKPFVGQSPEELVARAARMHTFHIVAISTYYEVHGSARLGDQTIQVPVFRHTISTIYPDGQDYDLRAASDVSPRLDLNDLYNFEKAGVQRVVLMNNGIWYSFDPADRVISTSSVLSPVPILDI